MKFYNVFLAVFASLTILSLTACSMNQNLIGNPEAPYPPADKPAVGDIYHLPTGTKVTRDQMHAAMTDARIIYVGETHDNPAAHRLELEVLKAVAEKYPGRVSLGMEMFNAEQQEALNGWSSGKLNEKSFLKESGWYSVWGQDFAYYRDLLNYAREQGIAIIGLNIPKELRREVSMNSLEDLDEETRAKLPEMDFGDNYQKAMAKAIFADHGNSQKILDSFIRVQTLWDESMAENIVRHLRDKSPDHRMVVVAGGNHIRYGFGIPRRVYRRMPSSYVLVGIREVVIPKTHQGKLMDVDMPGFPMVPYDYITYTEYETLPGERVKLGVRFKEANGRILVESVVPESAADKAGVKENDYIEFLDDQPIKESFDLIYEISNRRSGDEGELIVDRDGKPLSLKITFAPLPIVEQHGKHEKK